VHPATAGSADNAAAFEALYQRYSPNVFRFCLSQLRDVAAAEDVAADVFVSALTAFGRSEIPDDAVLYWLLRIARNQIVDLQRRNKRWNRVVERIRSRPQPAEDVQLRVELDDAMTRIVAALGTMTARDRMLVGLRYAGGLPFDEIGSLLGMKPSAAVMATRRAVEKLRATVGEDIL
jgi:RNA polymerase sigma-70 factor (ECF subfamily)